MLGGVLIDRHGYRATFLVTAGLQLTAAAILASVVFLVQRERRDAAPRASEASSAGYSLLAGEALVEGEPPPPRG